MGISAIDKLNEDDLLVYSDVNLIQMLAPKARAFYRYLRKLYQITMADPVSRGV